MADLNVEIAAYNRLRSDLEGRSLGKWALVHDEQLVRVFESFEDAATEAARQFGRGPYLIRQVGAGAAALPASVMYHPVHG